MPARLNSKHFASFNPSGWMPNAVRYVMPTRVARLFTRAILFVLLTCLVSSVDAAITKEQRAKITELGERVTEAGKLYSDGAFLACATQIDAIQLELVQVVESRDPAVLRLAKPIYGRLIKAREMLEIHGAELTPLPAWKELSKPAENSNDDMGISFKDDIAPFLVTACGNCHIENQRGQVSLASYAALARGARGVKLVYPGDAKGSRLVEVIENGDMPRGNAKVTDEQLSQLRKWIDEGAKFDGPNPNLPLQVFAASSMRGAASGSMDAPVANSSGSPTGDETVSFSRDVAPLLIENCTGCHINGRRASGNLRMDTFAQLLRGGDSGEVIAGSNANDSLLIRKLKGQQGQRMPAGRPPLKEQQIALIATWIREGAKFDGPSPRTNIDTVVGQGWASNATHAELFAKRKERALEKWNQVLPNDAPERAESDEVIVLGNVSSTQLNEKLQQIEAAMASVKKSLRADTKDPLVKGGLVAFVLRSRYDYSEFGRMTENRELPKEWIGHWQADPIDVYVVLAAEDMKDEKTAEALATQVVAGAYLGHFSDVPNWFAEGVARNLVVSGFRRSDDRIKRWQAALPSAMQKVESAQSLLNDRLDEEASGLVGMAMTNFMMSRGNRVRFDKLLNLMREGKTFTEATTFAFAPPEILVKSWLGKK